MAHKASFFEVAAFLTEIEPDYARAYSFDAYLRDCTAMRGEGRVVAEVQDRWPFLKRFWKDQSGAKPSEVIIILAIIGVALAGATILLSDSISKAFNGL